MGYKGFRNFRLKAKEITRTVVRLLLTADIASYFKFAVQYRRVRNRVRLAQENRMADMAAVIFAYHDPEIV